MPTCPHALQRNIPGLTSDKGGEGLRLHHKFILSVVVLFGLTVSPGCNNKPKNQPVTPAQTGTILLRPVGGARIEAERNQEVSLKVLATRVGEGAAAELPIGVAFVGSLRGGLTATALTTNANGFATVKLTTPDVDSGVVQVRFVAEGAPALTFSVVIGREVLSVGFVGKKPRPMKRSTEGDIIVKVENQLGAPVSGVMVTLEMQGQPDFGALIQGADNILSDGSGEARFSFYPGTELTTYRLKATGENANTATLDVIVADSIPEDNPCVFSSECANNMVCTDGVCVPGARRCRTNRPEDCPAGYQCSEENICIPACPNDDCTASGVAIDVTGRWKTFYQFDLSDTLGVLNKLGEPIAVADTLFQGKLPVDIPVFGPIIEAILAEMIRQFIPDWVPKLATALNTLWEAFSEMKVYGLMELYSNGQNLLRGSEVWQRVEVRIAALCPRRQSDPLWPSCATVNIQLNPNLGNEITAGATAKDFVGRVDGNTVTLQSRDAELEIKALVRNLIDLVINISTNGEVRDLKSAVVRIIDCPSLGVLADNIACDVTNGSTCHLTWFPGVCDTVATVLGQMVHNEVNKIPITWTLLNFDQTSPAVDDPPITLRADRMPDGTLSGDTNFFTDRPMTGTWGARR